MHFMLNMKISLACVDRMIQLEVLKFLGFDLQEYTIPLALYLSPVGFFFVCFSKFNCSLTL